MQHSWIDIRSGNVIGSPGLNNFSAHSDLGRVVQVIKREFELKPPTSANQIQTVQSSTEPLAPANTSWLNNQVNHHFSNSTMSNTSTSSSSVYYSQARGPLNCAVSANAQQHIDGSSQHSYYNRDINIQNQMLSMLLSN